ncbi:uroporphyrinogen-III synthase [Sphingomonas baiyangensis]|uniref:Uroporphyrinogen-III synthase n=1 Tax=Sphingomonas baiyangensis TaxID=2572576 RepID=A0A4U1L6F8_9SPHN|nr:uroporphyrinogen-III synthase [Sphingomonas baiyangensis]TKD51806.1 uroporphyrinogen-III synthase [Sphingomonas baiyangensis]
MIAGAAVLRPEPGNARTCAALAALGIDALSVPLFAVRAVAWEPPDPRDFDALLLTSAQAVRHAGPGLSALAGLPVIAVGAATARAAAVAGLSVAATGDGDAEAALALPAARTARRILHLAGRDRRVAAGGVIARIETVYASEALPVDMSALARIEGRVALVHSPRAGARLAELVDRHGPARRQVAIAAISDRAAAACGAGWQTMTVADRPADAALVAAAAMLIDRTGPHADKGA